MKTDNTFIKTANTYTCIGNLLIVIFLNLLFSEQAFAQDDGPRSYWNARAGTNIMSFQYLPISIGAADSDAFAPGQYIYPNANINANVFIGSYAHHMTILKRPSAFALNIIGGGVNANFNTNVPPEMVPPEIGLGATFNQTSSGFADPNMQLVMNLFGTPQLKSGVDMLNYEPKASLDAAVLVAVPIGKYDSNKLVNMGLNRWYGRFALPFKYHFGVFSPGYMSSFELTPSVWLFGENDDFIGYTMENEVMWQLEAHLTHDFNNSFFGSLDMLYQNGFQSKIDGDEVGGQLEIGTLGFALNYQISDNITIRTSYHANVFGDKNLETSAIRLQFVYAWHRATENMKKLMQGH